MAADQSTPSPREAAAQLLASPANYPSLRQHYTNETTLYARVRSAAPDVCSSFEDYRRLQHIFLTHEGATNIKSTIETWLPTTLVNMILGGSPRGRAFPLRTLDDVADRIAAYRELEINTPSLATFIDGYLEGSYRAVQSGDQSWRDIWAHTDQLLADTPTDAPDDAIRRLARFRAALELTLNTHHHLTDDTTPHAAVVARRFHACTTPPEPERPAPESAAQCLRRAYNIAPSHPDQSALFGVAVHRDPTKTDALKEYLYSTACDIIESFRHREPFANRAGLIVAERQLAALASCPPPSTRNASVWPRWVASYQALIYGVSHSQSLDTVLDDFHNHDFRVSAAAYQDAAEFVRPVYAPRGLKYESKAYRYRAHAADSITEKCSIHQAAITQFLEYAENDEFPQAHDTIQNLLRVHHQRTLMFEIEEAFESHDYDQVLETYIDYQEFSQSLSHIVGDNPVLETCHHLAYAMQSLAQDEPATATIYFEAAADFAPHLPHETPLEDLKQHALAPHLSAGTQAADSLAAAIAWPPETNESDSDTPAASSESEPADQPPAHALASATKSDGQSGRTAETPPPSQPSQTGTPESKPNAESSS